MNVMASKKVSHELMALSDENLSWKYYVENNDDVIK